MEEVSIANAFPPPFPLIAAIAPSIKENRFNRKRVSSTFSTFGWDTMSVAHSLFQSQTRFLRLFHNTDEGYRWALRELFQSQTRFLHLFHGVVSSLRS